MEQNMKLTYKHKLQIIFLTIFIYALTIINTGQAYDLEENVSTNHYWGLNQNENMRYSLSDYNKAIVVKHNGRDVVKLLQPGDLIVYCQKLNGNSRIYQIMLHISGAAIDGSLIDSATFEEECLNFVNQYRENAGLSPLRLSSELSYAASIRTKEITAVFEHKRPNGTDCFTVLPRGEYSYVGENIACNYGTPSAVIQGWIDSPAHRANILDPNFTEMGIAVYCNPQLEYNTYWVQFFGKK